MAFKVIQAALSMSFKTWLYVLYLYGFYFVCHSDYPESLTHPDVPVIIYSLNQCRHSGANGVREGRRLLLLFTVISIPFRVEYQYLLGENTNMNVYQWHLDFPGTHGIKQSCDQVDSIFKSRDITLSTKVRLVKAMFFPVVMYGCESWTVKKADWQRIDAFELRCWRRLLTVCWTARRSNQSILKEIGPGCSLGGLMLNWNSNTLATSCKELTHWRRLWCWEGLGAGGEGDDRGWDGWMASPTQWTWVWVNSGSWWWTGRPGVLGFMGLQRVRHNWETELNWITPINQ